MNRFFILILLILGGLSQASAQFSLQTQYHNHLNNSDEASSWPAQSMIEGSAHYWTRLKNYRLEFYPGILLQAHQLQENGSHLNLGASLPIAFYPLDFVNDCDCPTFSKNAFWFQKGFFIRLTPTWATRISDTSSDALDQILGAGIALGLDFGVSDLITISPIAGYNHLSSLSASDVTVSSLHFGVSLLFRNDYRKRYR